MLNWNISWCITMNSASAKGYIEHLYKDTEIWCWWLTKKIQSPNATEDLHNNVCSSQCAGYWATYHLRLAHFFRHAISQLRGRPDRKSPEMKFWATAKHKKNENCSNYLQHHFEVEIPPLWDIVDVVAVHPNPGLIFRVSKVMGHCPS